MFWTTVFTNQAFISDEKVLEDLLNLSQQHLLHWNERLELLAYRSDHFQKNQILLGLDDFKVTNVREGVRYLDFLKGNVLLNTLNKTEKDYSESTMYQDCTMSDDLFHWQSQNTNFENSKTGQRCQKHEKINSHVLHFARENKKNEYGVENYAFLGPSLIRVI